jgi:CMP-2-keto-3-deoxyoctulosonic acid synthetase
MILFHSNDGIDDLSRHFRQAPEKRASPATNGAGANRISPCGSNQLSRFLRAGEPGILSLPLSASLVTPLSRRPPANPILVIPSRLASTRLPGKPLADIAGSPMIVHVWRRAVRAGIGPVVVACGDPEIAAAVEREGGRAILTDPAHPTGSDRICEAVGRLDSERRHDAVVNVQGDLPMIDPEAIRAAVLGLEDPETDIATLAAVIREEAAIRDESVNKVAAGCAVPPARFIFRRPRCPGVRDPITNISGFTPIDAGRWSAS